MFSDFFTPKIEKIRVFKISQLKKGEQIPVKLKKSVSDYRLPAVLNTAKSDSKKQEPELRVARTPSHSLLKCRNGSAPGAATCSSP